MCHSMLLRIFLLLLLLASTACWNKPLLDASQVDTPLLSRQSGGTLAFTFTGTNRRAVVVLNQPSTTVFYVLAKLVQPGSASLDLVLTADSLHEHYQASLTPAELAMFQAGPAEVQISTPNGQTNLPLTLE